MDPYKVLKIGYKYSKAQLSENLKQPTISSPLDDLLFVEEKSKEDKRFHFK